jgi:hypothetical protein
MVKLGHCDLIEEVMVGEDVVSVSWRLICVLIKNVTHLIWLGLDHHVNQAHQILRSCGRRSMYGSDSRSDGANDRWSGALVTRCIGGDLADC